MEFLMRIATAFFCTMCLGGVAYGLGENGVWEVSPTTMLTSPQDVNTFIDDWASDKLDEKPSSKTTPLFPNVTAHAASASAGHVNEGFQGSDEDPAPQTGRNDDDLTTPLIAPSPESEHPALENDWFFAARTANRQAIVQALRAPLPAGSWRLKSS